MATVYADYLPMSFIVHLDPTRCLVESRWDGAAAADMLIRYVDEMRRDPAVRSYHELIDFRGVTDVQVPSADRHAFTGYSRQFDNPEQPARSAVIATASLVFGLSRLFSALRSLDSSDRREFQVFEDREIGRACLFATGV